MDTPKQNTQSSPSAISPEKPKLKTKVIVFNIIFFVLVSLGTWYFLNNYFNLSDEEFTDDAQVESFINTVNTRVSAYIEEIKFIEHQHVKKGDTLVLLVNSEIKTQVAQAEAAYLNALAAKNTTRASVNTVDNNKTVMEANIAGARARMNNAEQNLRRYENLVKEEAVTRQQYDQMKTEYEVAKASYQSLVNQKQTTAFSVDEVSSRLAINDAEIKRAAAALDMAKLNLSYTVITAPSDGIMGRRLINEGQLLQASQQVATIVNSENKWITANFRENQMNHVKVGDVFKIKVDALGGKQFEGRVTAIAGATGSKYAAVPVDNSTGNFVKVQQRIPVRIEFTSKNSKKNLDQLRAGMNVQITP